MQLSSGSSGSGNGDRYSVATFVQRKTPIEELHMNFYIPESLFTIEGQPAREGKFRVVVRICRPQHAAMTNEKYNISASGTITIDWFGDWSFTWDADAVTPTDTNTSTSSP